MAYNDQYKIEFTNEQNQQVVATIYRKDAASVPVNNYKVVTFELNDRSEGQTKYDSTIIARELYISLWTEDGDDITWETFITAEHDEWMIIVTIDGQFYFHGFITPDEGNSPFQDKPYEVSFRATNGLALLKDIPLVDINGHNFTGTHRLIDYIAGALRQTGLTLDILVYCNYYNIDMLHRRDALYHDMFNQSYLEYRTFLKNPVKYVSCYDALKIILDKFCRLEYWNGKWLIKNISELQYYPSKNYYTEYYYNGNVNTAGEDTTNHYQIGKSVDLYPINEDQQIYSRFAIKSAQTTYNYTVWPELPKNNKFERGTEFETGDQPDDEDIDGDGDTTEIIGTYKKLIVADWEYGQINWYDFPNPTMTTISEKFYRKSVYNIFGIETQRTIIAETPPVVTDSSFWLRSEAIPVNYGDRVNVSAQKRSDNNYVSGLTFNTVYVIYIVSLDGSKVVALTSGGVWLDAISWPFGLLIPAAIELNTGQSTAEWNSLDIKSPMIPFDGNMYVALHADSGVSRVGTLQYWKDIQIEYIPYLAGGYLKVNGEYWLRNQNKAFPDVAEDEVKISDSPKKLLKGALLKSDGNLTTPSWYRFGDTSSLSSINPLSESRHFKELLNIARYNNSYRRMYALDGSFNGLNCAAQNDQLNKFPIRFDKRYRLVDMTDEREFVLVPPLKMDLIKGWISANLVEVRKVADGNLDGTRPGDSASFNYLFEDNA